MCVRQRQRCQYSCLHAHVLLLGVCLTSNCLQIIWAISEACFVFLVKDLGGTDSFLPSGSNLTVHIYCYMCYKRLMRQKLTQVHMVALRTRVGHVRSRGGPPAFPQYMGMQLHFLQALQDVLACKWHMQLMLTCSGQQDCRWYFRHKTLQKPTLTTAHFWHRACATMIYDALASHKGIKTYHN